MHFKKFKFLIINFSFPPYPGTGGRRWSKFSKELVKLGHSVNVIGAYNDTAKFSSWTQEINDVNINYIPVKPLVPNIFFFFRIFKKAIKLFSYFNYNDISYFYLSGFKKKTLRIIREQNPDIIIISVPPYGLTCLIPFIKKHAPKKLIISDVRDTHKFYLKSLSNKKKKINEKKYLSNLSLSNMILTVNDYFTEYFKETTRLEYCFTLHNFYDENDLNRIYPSENPSINNEIVFNYTGNLIPECRIYVEALIEALLYVKEKDFELFQKIKVKIFGNQDAFIESIIKKHNLTNQFMFLGHVSSYHAQKNILSSNVCLIFPADFYAAYSLETKFFEYTYLRKPIITFPENGYCSDLITKHSLGIALPTENPGPKLLQFLHQLLSNEFKYNKNFNIEAYSLTAATDKLMEYINVKYEKK